MNVSLDDRIGWFEWMNYWMMYWRVSLKVGRNFIICPLHLIFFFRWPQLGLLQIVETVFPRGCFMSCSWVVYLFCLHELVNFKGVFFPILTDVGCSAQMALSSFSWQFFFWGYLVLVAIGTWFCTGHEYMMLADGALAPLTVTRIRLSLGLVMS